MMRHVAILAGILSALAAPPATASESFKIVTAKPDRMNEGTTAFIDTIGSPRIVEIDAEGKVVWQCSLADATFKSDQIMRGTDLEWIAADDTFLVAIPFSGIFRMTRTCRIAWRYDTRSVSHDADLLANGNVLYTLAWDTPQDDQAVEIDPSGRVVWRWRAVDHLPADMIANAERRSRPARGGRGQGQGGQAESRPDGVDGEGFTHANAVVRLADGDTLVSLRNFGRVARVAPDGQIRRFYGPVSRVHEPNLMANGTLIAADHRLNAVVALRDGNRTIVFANDIGIKPIRTVQPLARGHFLLSGGEDIVEIDAAGQVVWHVRIHRNMGERVRSGVYKAVRLAR